VYTIFFDDTAEKKLFVFSELLIFPQKIRLSPKKSWLRYRISLISDRRKKENLFMLSELCFLEEKFSCIQGNLVIYTIFFGATAEKKIVRILRIFDYPENSLISKEIVVAFQDFR